MEESPKKLMIALVLGTIVTLSVMLMMDTMTDSNPDALGSNYQIFKEKMNQSDNLNKSVSSMQSLVKGSSTGPLGVISSIINTLWNGVKTIFDSIGFFGTMLNSLSEIVGLPVWLGQLLFMVVTISLVFWLIDIIFRSS